MSDFTINDAEFWTLLELAARYYEHKKSDGCSPSFLSSIRQMVQYFLTWLKNKGFNPAENKPSDLTSALLAEYRQMLAEKTSISIDTANGYIIHVRMLLMWGWKMHGLRHPPLGCIQKFSSRKNAKKGHGRKHCRDPLTWQQLEKLFAVAGITDTALLMLGLNCGFGNMDIGTLKLSDIDFENGMISHPRPKTGVLRDFKLWPETINAIKLYIEKERGRPMDEEIDKLLFVGRRGNPMVWEEIDEKGKMNRSDAIKNRFRRLFSKAGLKKNYGTGFYILRHCYATIIGTCSSDPREVQAALGHVTFNQQEAYRHDRHQKALSAQKKVRGELHKTSIPQILKGRFSSHENQDDDSDCTAVQSLAEEPAVHNHYEKPFVQQTEQQPDSGQGFLF